MTYMKEHSFTLWIKVGDFSQEYSLVQLYPGFKLMTAVSTNTLAKVSYRNRDGGTVQFTALNLLEKDKWHYFTYGNNGINVEINIDFIDPLCTVCGDVLTAQPFYYLQRPQFIFGDLQATSKLSFGQFVMWKEYVKPQDMINERFNLRDTTLKYSLVIRYFKFERVHGEADRGDTLMDYSYNREHCVLLDTTIWRQEDILGDSLADFLSKMNVAPDYKTMENSHLKFTGAGPIFSGDQSPKRKSDFDDGFSFEFWFYLQSVPAGSWSLDLFKLTTVDGKLIKLTFSNTLSELTCALLTDTLTYPVPTITTSPPKWHHLSFSFSPAAFVTQVTLFSVGDPVQVGSAITWVSAQATLTMGAQTPIKNINAIEMFQTTDASFVYSLAEVRLWDTFRLQDEIVTFSKVNVTRLHLNTVVCNWRMVYELTNLGRGIFDQSNNQNYELPIPPPNNVQVVWDPLIPRLEVCNHTHRYEFTTGACTTAFTDDVIKADSHDFNFVNSTFFSLIMGQSAGFAGSWDWTVDFWMKKLDETVQTLIFFIGPEVDHHDYGDDLIQYPTLYTEIQQSKVQTAVDLLCFNYNLHECYDMTNADPPCPQSLLNCTADFPNNNSTAKCVNNCQNSVDCDAICKGVTECRIFCDLNSQQCVATFMSSALGQFMCSKGNKCTAFVQQGSDDFIADCTQTSSTCDITMTDSFNLMTPITEADISVERYINCDNSKDCKLTASNTKDLLYQCQNSDTCTVDIVGSTNTKTPWYAANVILAKLNQKPKISLENVDRAIVDCTQTKKCDVSIVDPTNFMISTCDPSMPLYHKVQFSGGTSTSKAFIDQTGSPSMSGFAIVNCATAQDCDVTIKGGPSLCTNTAMTQMINCQGTTCTNQVSDTYQIKIDCIGSNQCKNTIENAVTPSNPAILNFPEVLCSGSTTKCDNTFKDVNVFSLDCNTSPDCKTKLSGTTATTQVDHAGSMWATYSNINCQAATFCDLDLKNGASQVFVDLRSAIASPASPQKVQFASGSEQTLALSGGTYYIYPIVYAQASENLEISMSMGSDVFVDCSNSKNCDVAFTDSVRDPNTYPSVINCSESLNCNVDLNKNAASYVKCDLADSCTVSITTTTTTYSSCVTTSPGKTFFNLVDCTNSVNTCSVTCDDPVFCNVLCTGAADCQVTIKNNLLVPSLTCGAQAVRSQIDCTSATKCSVTLDNVDPTIFVNNCKTDCSYVITDVKAIKTGAVSQFQYIDCSNTNMCTTTLTNVEEFYINCLSTVTSCTNTISTSYLTWSEYTNTGHSGYSYVLCSGLGTCTTTVTEHTQLFYACNSASCTLSLSNLVPAATATSGLTPGYKMYPKVRCLSATGKCENTVNTATGVGIECANINQVDTCKNTLTAVGEFWIQCNMQNCLNAVAGNSASVAMAFNSLTETQYSIIDCAKAIKTCTNSLTTVSQVYISCTFNGITCTNTFTTTKRVAEGSDYNFPYVDCLNLATGKCLNTFTGYEQLYIDCQGTGNAVCDTTIKNGPNLAVGESVINLKTSTGGKASCISTLHCFIDCEGATNCIASSATTNKAAFTAVTSFFPILNMKSCISCTATCLTNSDCLIYAQSSSSGTFTVKDSLTTGYSVIDARGATNPINICDSVPACFIYCDSAVTACTSTLMNLPATTTTYSLIACPTAVPCVNTCKNQLQCFINCQNALSCTSTLSLSPASGLTSTLQPTVDCRGSTTCTTTCDKVDGCFVDCSGGTGVCTMTISDSPVTAVVAADLADTSIPLHLKCQNGLAGSSCVVSVTNSKMVLVDCTGAKSCKVDIQKGQWVEVICINAVSCIVTANDVDNLNVQCSGATTCTVTSNDVTTPPSQVQEVNCMNAGKCSLTASAVDNLKYSCEGATVSCTIALTGTKLNTIITKTAAGLSLACALPATYTGTIYSGTGAFTVPANCLTMNSVPGNPAASSLTSFSYFAASLATRDISTIFAYSVPLVSGLPSYLSQYTTRKATLYSILSNKPTAKMKKTTFFDPVKLNTLAAAKYNYQFLPADGHHPPYQVMPPLPVTFPTTMIPAITYLNQANMPNATLPQTCINWKFDSQYSGPATFSYKDRYQIRQDYMPGEWNYVAMHQKDNDFRICINRICDSDALQLNDANLLPYKPLQKEMRFFYNFQGRIHEFKIWKGEQLRTAFNYRQRLGPWTSFERGKIVAYYRFSKRQTNTADEFIFEQLTQTSYASTSPRILIMNPVMSTHPLTFSADGFVVCTDGRHATDFHKCSSMNSVLVAESTSSSLPIYKIDFDQPTEISINFWFKGYCTTTTCMIVDGPFQFGMYIPSPTIKVFSEVNGVVRSGNLPNTDQWYFVTQQIWKDKFGTQYFQLLVSADKDMNILIDQTASPFTYTWPFGQTIYMGKDPASATKVTLIDLKLKNYMFLKYKLSGFEHRYLPHTEYLYKRAALFYFSFNDVKYAGVSSGFTPEQERLPLKAAGFIWERDTIVPLLCPEDGDYIYDYFQVRCMNRNQAFLSKTSEYLQIPQPFPTTAPSINDESFEFTISMFVKLEFTDYPMQPVKSSIFSIPGTTFPDQMIEVFLQKSPTKKILMLHLHESQPATTSTCLLEITGAVAVNFADYYTRWIFVSFSRTWLSPVLTGTLTFNDYTFQCTFNTNSLGGTPLSLSNELLILPNPNPAYASGRVKHLRVYWEAVSDPQTVRQDRYFDIRHSTVPQKYYPMETMHADGLVMDHKRDDYSIVTSGSWVADGHLTWMEDINNYVDDYTHSFTAVQLLSSPSVVAFASKSAYASWSLDFYYAVDIDPQIDIQAITLSGFLTVHFIYQPATLKYRLRISDGGGAVDTSVKEFDLMQPNNHTHIAISYYAGSGTISLKFFVKGEYVHNSAIAFNAIPTASMSLSFSDKIYFKYFRLWNTFVKSYPLMQLRNKGVNYFLHRERLLLFYDINYNREYHPYRMVYYNKQLMVADDSMVLVDPSPTVATSPTMNLVNNYCKANQTYDWQTKSCQQYLFLPLSQGYANQIKLPLQRGVISDQAVNKDFILGFWILLRDGQNAGHFMQLNFDRQYIFKEDSTYSLNFIDGATNHQLAVDRTAYDRTRLFKTGWRYLRMSYLDSPRSLKFHMEKVLLQTFTAIQIDLSQAMEFNMILCPKPPAATYVDCNTVIAHVKIWLTSARRFLKECDFRMTLEPNLDLKVYWPLTYNATEMPIGWDEITDLGRAKYRVKLHYSHIHSNALWVTSSEIDVDEAESLIMCELGTSFEKNQDILVPRIDDNNIVIYRADKRLMVNLTYWSQTEYTTEWTVEFWFKFGLDFMNQFNFNHDLKVVEHTATGTCATSDSRFLFVLLPKIETPFVGSRNPTTTVYQGSSVSTTFTDLTNDLKTDTWYHFGLVNDHKESLVRNYVNYIAYQQAGLRLKRLTECPFYIGDELGDPVKFFEDSFLSVKELRTWNEARSFGQLKWFSNRAIPNDTMNIRSYYKLSEHNYELYETVQNKWLYPIKPTVEFGTYEFIQYDADYAKFDISCPSGFVGGVGSCYPLDDWIQNKEKVTSGAPAVTSYFPAVSTFDIGTPINDRILYRDVQITVAIQIKPLKVTGSYKFFSIENLVELYRVNDQYQIVLYFEDSELNDVVDTKMISGSFLAGSYQFLFLILDQPNQRVYLVSQDSISTYTDTSHGYIITAGYSFKQVDPVQFVILGGDEPTLDNYVAINQVSIYTHALRRNEMHRIFNLGMRTSTNFDSSLLVQLKLASNPLFNLTSQNVDFRTHYATNYEQWPLWVENSVADPLNVNPLNIFDTVKDPRKISFCPEGEALNFNYPTGQHQYTFCQQRSAFTMRGQVSQAFQSAEIKSNTRYSWSFRERFRFLNLDSSITGSFVDIFHIQGILRVKIIDDLKLEIILYNLAGVAQPTQQVNLSSPLGKDWHELTGTLFNFNWTFNLDGIQLLKTADSMLYYNLTTSPGSAFTISLQSSHADTVLQVADVAILGIPLTTSETSLWVAHSQLNLRQLEGRLIVYYDLSTQSFQDAAQDLSAYSKTTQFTAKAAGQISDLITWSYQEDSQIYLPSDLADKKSYEQGFHHIFSRDKHLLFTRQPRLKMTSKLKFDSEMTFELCYMYYDIQSATDYLIQVNTQVAGGTSMISSIQLNNTDPARSVVSFTPFHTVPAHTFSANAGLARTWQCITASASFEKKMIYISNFYGLRDEMYKLFYFDEYISKDSHFLSAPLNTVYDGDLYLGQNFYGSIRELKLWSTALSPAISHRFYRSRQLIYHNPYLAAYWPMNDGYGTLLKEYVYQNHTTFSRANQDWVKFNNPSENLEICEGENVFSEGGYCLNREKFLKLRSGYAALQFTIKEEAGKAKGYPYDLMTHSTIVMWMCMKRLNSTVKPSRNLFEMQVSKRYTVTIDSNEKFQLDSDAMYPKTIVSGIDFSNFYDGWGFISIACSKLTTYCEVHRGLFNQNYDTFKSKVDNNGVLEPRFYHNEMQFWKNIQETQVSIFGPVEGHLYQLFLKEFQVYQVQLPLQAILLKMRMGITSKLFPSLIVHLKMDEYSGQRLYNYAFDTANSFSYIDVDAVSWHHYQETVAPGSLQAIDPVKYMFCYKENFTQVGDHCEYFQCHQDCTGPGKIGHCTGWTNSECVFIDTTGLDITYDPQYNDYLSCYKLCTTCVKPLYNEGCSSCVKDTVFYQDKQGLMAVANGSCWEYCPISTYEQYVNGNRICRDCPAFCTCDGINVNCPGCMNSTFKLDRKRGLCIKECPVKTYYSDFEQTCVDCSYSCQKCKGPSPFDCLECIPGLFMFKTQDGLICDNRNCQKGFYYDPDKTACSKCSEECEECEGPKPDQCIGDYCAYSYIKVANPTSTRTFQCRSCLDIASENDKYSPTYEDKSDYCDEICGDGFNMGIRECDDGNRVDKDGCSSDCRVERNYRCRGGGTTTKDKCQKILPISGDVNLKIDSIINSEKGSLAIEFDEKVKLNPKHQADFKEKIKVFLNGTCESYDLKYQIVLVQDRFGWESIKINYAIDFNIPENSQCKINVGFTEKGLFIGRDGSEVSQQQFNPIDMPPFKKASNSQLTLKSAADKLQSVMISFLIANLVVGFIMGDGMQHMWFLINQLQLIYYIPLINVKFHEFAKFVYSLLVFAIADFFDFVPQYFDYFLDFNQLDDRPFNDRYKNLQMENIYIITGYYKKFAAFLVMGMIYPLAYLGSKIKNKYLSMPFKIILSAMTYGVPLQFFFELYLELSVIIWVAVFAGINYSTFPQAFSSILTMLIFLTVTVAPIYSYAKIMDCFDQLHLPSFRDKFLPLIESTKLRRNSTVNQMWIPIFLFRRYTYAAILCVFQDVPIFQILFCILQSCLTLAYLISVRPFESWDLNFVSVFYEFSVLIAFLLLILFMHDYSESEGLIISWILTAVIAIDIGIAMIFLVWDMFKKIKKMALKGLQIVRQAKKYLAQKYPEIQILQERQAVAERGDGDQSQLSNNSSQIGGGIRGMTDQTQANLLNNKSNNGNDVNEATMNLAGTLGRLTGGDGFAAAGPDDDYPNPDQLRDVNLRKKGKKKKKKVLGLLDDLSQFSKADNLAQKNKRTVVKTKGRLEKSQMEIDRISNNYQMSPAQPAAAQDLNNHNIQEERKGQAHQQSRLDLFFQARRLQELENNQQEEYEQEIGDDQDDFEMSPEQRKFIKNFLKENHRFAS